MPSKYALNVTVTEHLSNFVAAQVASGRFGTISEVVRAGLRLLEQELAGFKPVQSDGQAWSDTGSAATRAGKSTSKRLAKPRTAP